MTTAAEQRTNNRSGGLQAMSEWQYRKIELNQAPRNTDDIDLLCDAGEEGWELVVIMANNVAYPSFMYVDYVRAYVLRQ